eukprot:972804_1
MARFKKFLHRSCMLAVCVTVVLHSLPVGVGAASKDDEKKEKEQKKAATLNALKEKVENALKEAVGVQKAMEGVYAALATAANAEVTLPKLELDVVVVRLLVVNVLEAKADLTNAKDGALKQVNDLKEKLQTATNAKNDALQQVVDLTTANSGRVASFVTGAVVGGGAGLAAGKYILGAGPAPKDDTPTGDGDTVTDEGSQDADMASGAVGVTMGLSIFLAILVPFGLIMFT